MSGNETASKNAAPKGRAAQDVARTKPYSVPLVLPNGVEVVLTQMGRNDFSEHGYIGWLRRDGTTNVSALPWVPKAKDGVTPSQIRESAGSPGSAPFPEGHELATRHGAHSARRVEPIAAELVETVLEHAPFLAEPSFDRALRAWARAEARCALLDDWLDEHGLLDDEGTPRPAAEFARKQEELALKHRTRLGLDAASRAQIEASLTGAAVSKASLEQLLAQGAEAVRARRRSQDSPEAPTGSPEPAGVPEPAGEVRASQIATGEDR